MFIDYFFIMIFLYLRIYALKELLLLYNLNVQSLPLRERGLKLKRLKNTEQKQDVAPLAGAWIETYDFGQKMNIGRRSPCGSVD